MKQAHQKAAPNLRIGPVSIFVLMVVLCLATLVMLSVVNAKAQLTITEKHASTVTQTYANEQLAQQLVASVDLALYDLRANAQTGTGEGEGAGADEHMQAQIEQALYDVQQNFEGGSVNVQGQTLQAHFEQEAGQMLDVTLEIQNDATYAITQWQCSTNWENTQSADTLWQGL